MRGGWHALVENISWLRDGLYPIAAYSEFMPAPLVGVKPYGGGVDHELFHDDDPYGWHVNEYQERLELRPGFRHIAQELTGRFGRLSRGEPAHGIAKKKLDGNPCWPPALREASSRLDERIVLILPLALSRTQDDKGRVRWTLFGASDQGADAPFWSSFASSHDFAEWAARLLAGAYGERSLDLFRVYDEHAIASRFAWRDGDSLRNVEYLLTFTPFADLPRAVQRAYIAGNLRLLPFPGSLLVFHIPAYQQLRRQLPSAMQIPLLHLLERNEAVHSIRIPQSGWMHEPRIGEGITDVHHHGPVRNTMHRTHRWERVHRHENELEVLKSEDNVAHLLFSTAEQELGLYGKPMARNAQLWTSDYRLLLDGPNATREDLRIAASALEKGGIFGYRFLYPPMRVGQRDVYWHRPLVAWNDEGGVQVQDGAPLGYLLAGDVRLMPRLIERPERLTVIEKLRDRPHERWSARKVLDAADTLGAPLDPGFARSLMTVDVKHLPAEIRASIAGATSTVTTTVRGATFAATAKRSFETRYWRTIAQLAQGRFINKDNADCVLDRATQSRLVHRWRDLERLGDFLIDYYADLKRRHRASRALVGAMPFHWETDFIFEWMGGWIDDQQKKTEQRNIVFVIPGRDRSRAVIMADHYDTAYMEDRFGKSGRGPRLAAPGADDNHSATAALMRAAPIFLAMSRARQLACDIWLVHLTGEEFPSDCLGARHLCRSAVEHSLAIRTERGKLMNLGDVAIKGAFILDMVAHNNDRAPDIFQICPGGGRDSMLLARTAQHTAEAWNEFAARANQRGARRKARPAKRSADPRRIPAIAPHRRLRAQVRPQSDPHSTLYNTDGQIFSDAGIPVVLFMENYDINRHGYHDSHDTMENIDLDYGAALTAIAIETVAAVAS